MIRSIYKWHLPLASNRDSQWKEWMEQLQKERFWYGG